MSLQPSEVFIIRITNVWWNSIPFFVVTATSVNSFKNRLDKHWTSQELRYDWKAELSGTGSRSRACILSSPIKRILYCIVYCSWISSSSSLPLYVLHNDMGRHNIRYVMLILGVEFPRLDTTARKILSWVARSWNTVIESTQFWLAINKPPV